ncbi:reverse transcriptase domain-containing protein [Tanacetum coccineum]
MTPTNGMEVIKELSAHSISWYEEGNVKTEDKAFQVVLNQINKFKNNINNITEEVRMAQHKYETPMEGRFSNLKETLNKFIKESRIRQKESESIKITTTLSLFLGRLKKEKDKEQFKKFFENLQQLSINILFLEALEQMPKYAKFMKDLLARKGKTEEKSKITLNERCSAVLLNKIPIKEKDPGSFTILCIIEKMGIDKALVDLGANISLMPYSMYERLDLGELKTTRMCIELANKST